MLLINLSFYYSRLNKETECYREARFFRKHRLENLKTKGLAFNVKLVTDNVS
jgi:hypothetical protein